YDTEARERLHRLRILLLRRFLEKCIALARIANEARKLGSACRLAQVGRVSQAIFDRLIVEAGIATASCGSLRERCLGLQHARCACDPLRRQDARKLVDLLAEITRRRRADAAAPGLYAHEGDVRFLLSLRRSLTARRAG